MAKVAKVDLVSNILRRGLAKVKMDRTVAKLSTTFATIKHIYLH